MVDHGQPPYMDKDGHVRTNARVRWWNGEAKTLDEIAEISSVFTTEDGEPYPDLPSVEVYTRKPVVRVYAAAFRCSTAITGVKASPSSIATGTH